MKVQVINKSQNALPAYETENSAGIAIKRPVGHKNLPRGGILTLLSRFALKSIPALFSVS